MRVVPQEGGGSATGEIVVRLFVDQVVNRTCEDSLTANKRLHGYQTTESFVCVIGKTGVILRGSLWRRSAEVICLWSLIEN